MHEYSTATEINWKHSWHSLGNIISDLYGDKLEGKEETTGNSVPS